MPNLPNPASAPAVALTVAGSDNSAGAGIQADLKTFIAHEVYGLTAVTCVVAEVPGLVSSIGPVAPAIVAEQVRLSFEAFPIAALKTGMLYSTEIIHAVCEVLEHQSKNFEARGGKLQFVVDPVMIASSGDPLLEPSAIEAYRERLFPLATLVTPNLDETWALVGRPLNDHAAMREAGLELAQRYNAAFLVKGGHLPGEAIDLLVAPDGEVQEFRSGRIEGVSTHGTGCTFSAAVTAQLALGKPLPRAVELSKEYVTRAIARAYRWPAPCTGNEPRRQRIDAETHGLNHEQRALC